MTNLAGFIIIVVKGLLHSDWLGAGPAASPISASWERERWENLANPLPRTIDRNGGQIQQVFLTLPR
jgi:hypothetical protein